MFLKLKSAQFEEAKPIYVNFSLVRSIEYSEEAHATELSVSDDHTIHVAESPEEIAALLDTLRERQAAARNRLRGFET
jgi:hypothetical protein